MLEHTLPHWDPAMFLRITTPAHDAVYFAGLAPPSIWADKGCTSVGASSSFDFPPPLKYARREDMKFGILYETQRPYKGNDLDWNSLYKETLDQCELADQMGFDNLWFVEHHFLMGFSGSPCPEVLFGALSQRTKNIRIGFGVSILPSHHPIHIAERVAMVDQLTDGRVEFGTGRSNAYEQVGQGIDPRETRERWDEALTMLPKMWQSDEFS
ncbi:MAG TPA: LLM class flavin-dependent oxidoreductase, partial [Dehalococcoidia bacterium]|nr:LLM class flavin-dependent oxidoreductase [Dehalococcoidia bacterium]